MGAAPTAALGDVPHAWLCVVVARGDGARVRYKWWKQRLTQMSSYFHAYRIDHILGFFRIWQIPAHGVTGLLGASV